MRREKFLTATAVAVCLGLTGITASAETFRAATYNAPGSPVANFLEDFAAQVKEATGGNIEFEVIAGGVLFPADGAIAAMETGVAHITNLTATYFPSIMPVDAVTTDASFVADNQMATAFAKTEISFFNEQLQAEYSKINTVFGTGFTIGIYNLICGFEADSLDDFQGKKLRTSSGAMISFAESIGGVAVTVAAPEIYTGIQRGSLDCTFGSPLFLTDFFKLTEVAKSVYTIPLGTSPNGGYVFNKDFWIERTPEERKILLKAASRATAKSLIDWGGSIDKAWEAARAAGVAINEPEPAAVEHLRQFNEKLLADLPKSAMEQRGVEDPTELLAQYNSAIQRWKGLLAEIDTTSVDEVSALLDREIFDKVDLTTYGTK